MLRLRLKHIATLALLVLATWRAPQAVNAQTLQIDSATANWIEGFADFTRWPNESQKETLTIGVINAPEVATYLQRRANKRASKPDLEVIDITAESSFARLDILYVGPGVKERWKKIFEKCHGQGILCIGAQEGFSSSGGCVELVVRKNRLRFYINTNHARQCDVALSSKLLELALEPKQ